MMSPKSGRNSSHHRHNQFVGVALLLIAPVSTIAHQPPFYEAKEGFYKARGVRVTASWSLDRTVITDDEELLATLRITGATNPHEIERPDLRKLNQFTLSFRSIVDVPSAPVDPNATEVAFSYRLRPRDRSVNRLPSMDFFYSNPAITNADSHQNARVRGVEFTVTAAATPLPPSPVPMNEPERLFDIHTDHQSLLRPAPTPHPILWIVVFAAGPVLAISWFTLWRRLFPGSARLVQSRRDRAARHALGIITKAKQTSDPAGVIAAALRVYLQTRLSLPADAATPREIQSVLGDHHSEFAADIVAFFDRLDRVRFSPTNDNGTLLAEDAADLITRLETSA